MPGIEIAQQELVEDFALLENWEDKYELIIDLGKELQPIDPAYKSEEYLIKGCQSRVWLHADLEDEQVRLSADSDAVITRGLVSLVIRVLGGHKPQEILDADLHFMKDIGLQDHLSPTRANGLLSMIKQIKLYALVFAGANGNVQSERT